MLFCTFMSRRNSNPIDGNDHRSTSRDDELRPSAHRSLDDDDLEILDRQLFSEDAEAVDRRRDPLRK